MLEASFSTKMQVFDKLYPFTWSVCGNWPLRMRVFSGYSILYPSLKIELSPKPSSRNILVRGVVLQRAELARPAERHESKYNQIYHNTTGLIMFQH